MAGEEVFTGGNEQGKTTGNRLPLRNEAGNGDSLGTGLPRGWEHQRSGLHKVME